MPVAPGQHQLDTLLRAKPPKGGDAELRDYRDTVAKSAGPPANSTLAARFFCTGGADAVHLQAVSASGADARSGVRHPGARRVRLPGRIGLWTLWRGADGSRPAARPS